jgi:hypothetical protein
VLPVIPPPAGAGAEQASKDEEDVSVDDVDDVLAEEDGSICDIREASIWLA